MAEANSNGPKHIISKAVHHFPVYFRGSKNANLIKASRLWKAKEEFYDDSGNEITRGSVSSLTRVTRTGHKTVYVKEKPGRGRKRPSWDIDLHEDFLLEFERLRKLGVKFNLKTLRALTIYLIENSERAEYSANFVETSGKRVRDMITARWIQSFTERFRIVSRALTGELLTSPAKELFIEEEVAYHFRVLARSFRNGEIDEDNIENADETHFVINMDNGRMLGFVGGEEVKYADVVSGGEVMTMVVRISGGRDSKVEIPFMVFQKKSRSYPIRGVPDTVGGVSYRSGQKGWMDTTVMTQWLSEKKVITKLPHDWKRILYLDSCSGHNQTAELDSACTAINTEIRYFPKNATHLVQPADSFVIEKIKRAWTTRWEEHKMGLIQRNEWADGSGKLRNPGKSLFLELAAAFVRDVNRLRDENGLTHARKAMIRTGMALNINGQWEECQLFPKLQEIINKHRAHFDRQPVIDDIPPQEEH